MTSLVWYFDVQRDGILSIWYNVLVNKVTTHDQIEFLLALLPLDLLILAEVFSPMYGEGSNPSSSILAKISIAARYPSFWMSSNLPNCRVPY